MAPMQKAAVPGPTGVEDATARVLRLLDAGLETTARDVVDAIRLTIPAFAGEVRPRAAQATLETCRIIVRGLATGTLPEGEDLPFMRRQRLRPRAGLSPQDLMRAYQVGQAVLWAAIVELARDDEEAGAAALVLGGHLMQVVLAIAGLHVAVKCEDGGWAPRLEEERADEELLDRLLSGRSPEPGGPCERAARAGLVPGARCLAISAAAAGSPGVSRHRLQAALRRAVQEPLWPLSVIREDEVVLLVPAGSDRHGEALVARLERTAESFAREGTPISIGVSTLFDDPVEAAAAHAEARRARKKAGGQGVVAFCRMSALEYLASLGDATAQRLVPEHLRAFLADDEARGGELVATLHAYAGADLNATLTAERLHMHVNTVRYRLARIEERTGYDLRRLADVLELLLAARLRVVPMHH